MIKEDLLEKLSKGTYQEQCDAIMCLGLLLELSNRPRTKSNGDIDEEFYRVYLCNTVLPMLSAKEEQDILERFIDVAQNPELRPGVFAALGKAVERNTVAYAMRLFKRFKSEFTENDCEQMLYAIYSHIGNFSQESLIKMRTEGINGFIDVCSSLTDKNVLDVLSQIKSELE